MSHLKQVILPMVLIPFLVAPWGSRIAAVPAQVTAPARCTAWYHVPSPSPGAGNNVLLGVAAVSARNVWAVGYYRTATAIEQTLIEHWDGTAWQDVPAPVTPGRYTTLYSIAALSARDLWTVGTYAQPFTAPQRTLIGLYC